jgi:peptidoglycan hydrolase-like protein with peptidoglycan-binding domain
MSVCHAAARTGPVRLLAALFCLAVIWSAGAAAQTSPRDLEDVQRRLVTLGYDAGSPDGLLGPKTRAALRAFQGDRGLPATGRPDGATLEALYAPNVPPPPETAPPGDEPPSLEAVPLEPVATEPLEPAESPAESLAESPAESPAEAPAEAPSAGPAPDAGLTSPTPDSAFAVQPDVTASSEPAAPSAAPAESGTVAGSAQRDDWFEWVAAALAVFGALVFFAALRRRSARSKSSRGSAPPMPGDDPIVASEPRQGHVFGIDVPPPKRRRRR